MSLTTRTLEGGDEVAVERFLATRSDSSMILLSNLRAAGLEYRGEPMQATWVGALEEARIVAVAAHCWNGKVIVQAPRELGRVVELAVAASGREVTGILGEWAQAVATREVLGLDAKPSRFASRDLLFALDLARLRVPAALASGRVSSRRARRDDVDLLTRWRMAYNQELLGAVPGPGFESSCRAEMELAVELGGFLLEAEGGPVSYSGFNARLPECVQVGGVFTPPELRGAGFARSAVAGSLLAVASEGVVRSVLFTGDENFAAQRAYAALGYEVVGDFGMILFA
jgi:predicted GNAT family acetyltransferase